MPGLPARVRAAGSHPTKLLAETFQVCWVMRESGLESVIGQTERVRMGPTGKIPPEMP